MCNCLAETKEKLAAELNSIPEYKNLKITEIHFCHETLILRKKSFVQLTYPVIISHEPIGRKKQTKLNMAGSYCPFCGEKYEKGE